MTVATAEDLYIPTWDDVLAAHERVRPYIHKTPILTSRFINELAGAELFFKCENLQKAGAFKVRGACNAVFGLSDEKARKGVATHSSGNHALSLSYAAGRRGIPCHVVMPRTAPQAKKDAVKGYGGIITECEPSTSSREEVFAKVQAETGADFVEKLRAASDDPRLIVVEGSAEDVGRHLEDCDLDRADLILSGLPFSTLVISRSSSTHSAARRSSKDPGLIVFLAASGRLP